MRVSQKSRACVSFNVGVRPICFDLPSFLRVRPRKSISCTVLQNYCRLAQLILSIKGTTNMIHRARRSDQPRGARICRTRRWLRVALWAVTVVHLLAACFAGIIRAHIWPNKKRKASIISIFSLQLSAAMVPLGDSLGR